jgi:hypothetical protein
MQHHHKAGRPLVFVLATTLIATVYARQGLAGVDVSVNIGLPAPPVVVFPAPPAVVVIPGTRVYYVQAATEYDMYRLGVYWYINQDGYWYRSRRYRGPFKLVAYHRVPRQIVVVPVEYRHHPLHPSHPHGGPPGHLKHFRHGKGHGEHEH